MADREEDVDYPVGGQGSPQAARKAFGEPETWMQWRPIDYAGSVGSYSGFKKQDENKPFILYGGGFNDTIKYIGSYTAICNGIIPVFNEHVHLKSLDNVKNYFPFNAFPAHVLIGNTTSNQVIECEVYPINWVEKVDIAPNLKKNNIYKDALNIKQKINNIAKFNGFVEITEKGRSEKHIIAKIKNINHEYIDISFLYLGKGFDLSYDVEEKNEIVLRFILPEETVKYKSEIENSYPSMITFDLSNPSIGYIILKNGLYLRLLGITP